MLRGVTTTLSNPDHASGVRRRSTAARLTGGLRAGALLVGLALLAGGCWVVEPQLSPIDPPPNLEKGQLLLEIPQSAVDAMATQSVVRTLDLALSGAQDKLGTIALPEGHSQRILLHQVVTGMTQQEVVWCFLSHPTRHREQGPPGGATLLWEPPGIDQGDRYWVRFDDDGFAWAAGLY